MLPLYARRFFFTATKIKYKNKKQVILKRNFLGLEVFLEVEKYLKTKFVWYMIIVTKDNHNGTRQTYQFVSSVVF